MNRKIEPFEIKTSSVSFRAVNLTGQRLALDNFQSIPPIDRFEIPRMAVRSNYIELNDGELLLSRMPKVAGVSFVVREAESNHDLVGLCKRLLNNEVTDLILVTPMQLQFLTVAMSACRPEGPLGIVCPRVYHAEPTSGRLIFFHNSFVVNTADVTAEEAAAFGSTYNRLQRKAG